MNPHTDVSGPAHVEEGLALDGECSSQTAMQTMTNTTGQGKSGFEPNKVDWKLLGVSAVAGSPLPWCSFPGPTSTAGKQEQSEAPSTERRCPRHVDGGLWKNHLCTYMLIQDLHRRIYTPYSVQGASCHRARYSRGLGPSGFLPRRVPGRRISLPPSPAGERSGTAAQQTGCMHHHGGPRGTGAAQRPAWNLETLVDPSGCAHSTDSRDGLVSAFAFAAKRRGEWMEALTGSCRRRGNHRQGEVDCLYCRIVGYFNLHTPCLPGTWADATRHEMPHFSSRPFRARDLSTNPPVPSSSVPLSLPNNPFACLLPTQRRRGLHLPVQCLGGADQTSTASTAQVHAQYFFQPVGIFILARPPRIPRLRAICSPTLTPNLPLHTSPVAGVDHAPWRI